MLMRDEPAAIDLAQNAGATTTAGGFLAADEALPAKLVAAGGHVIGDDRPRDGLCLAIVEKSTLFSDETTSTPEIPGSIERIARGADEARFQKRDAVLPLLERHILPGKLVNVMNRRPLRVVD
jgi:hypothetical protein